jgi:zinc protease
MPPMKAARILLAMAALMSVTPAAAELDLSGASVSHLPNGLTLIMLEDRTFPLVSVQMLYKSGSAAEVTGKTGLAHFLEHLAFRASKNFPDARATELIYDPGGEWHGYTAMDQTTYFATMPKEGLELLLEIEADRMARTVIDEASIEAEKGAVITELHSYENDPSSVLLETVTRTALQVHPYGSPMAGYVSDVERLTADDARAYYASHYAPANAVLAIAGDFAPTEARALVATVFADVPGRPVATPNPTTEPPQRGERRTIMLGAVERQYFQFAYPSPAASNPDFPAFLVLQEILSGGSGLNLRQSDFMGTAASEGSLLAGATQDIATWLPPTRDPFLFTISGSIDSEADRTALERDVQRRVATIRDDRIVEQRLGRAKAAVKRAIEEDVQTTEDAAHQLAFFEGIGALGTLLDMPPRIELVAAADIRRIAQTYLSPQSLTVGWMVPGSSSNARAGGANPRPSANRDGAKSTDAPARKPQLQRLSGGLPAVVQSSPLSNRVTVELLLSAPVEGGTPQTELAGLGAVVRSGRPKDLASLLRDVATVASKPSEKPEPRSDDPATRLEQLISALLSRRSGEPPLPVAVFVAGNVDSGETFGILERQLGRIRPGKLSNDRAVSAGKKLISERIPKPLAQGGLGYVAKGPRTGTREALAWRMLLYVLTHDYSGRLGRSAIGEKGIVYYIGSSVRTSGTGSWATISIGVDPDKADAMEAELRAQIANLVSHPPSAAEVEAARNHLLGRDLTADQSNEELAAKLTREFVDTNGLRSHEQLRQQLMTITPADLAKLAPVLASGTIIRVNVGMN